MGVTNKLLNKIDRLCDKYNYLNISKEDIMQILHDEMSKLKDNDEDKYIIYISHIVEAKIITMGMELFSDGDKSLNIIDNYIKYNIGIINTYDKALDNLKKVSRLFSKYSYIPEPNTIMNLISINSIFKDMVELVSLKHLTYIKEGKLNRLFNDHNIILMIDVYCMTKNIEIQYDDNSDDDISNLDSIGMYYKEINNIPLISYEDAKELNVRIKNGDEDAKKRFIEGNLKLVVKNARNYYNPNSNTLLLDLIQAGNIGLMKAVIKYDASLGYRFSTYASCWINTEVVREIQNNGSTVKIPIPVHEKINTYKRIKQILEQKSGTSVSMQEVAKEMKIPIIKAMEYEKLQEEPLSLNYMLGEEESSEMIEFVSDNSFMEEMELHYLSSDLKKLIKDCGLTSREIQILSLRYGLEDGITRTLEEVGVIFKVKKETIRRIEANALYKIRSYNGTREIANYMDNPDMAIKKLERFKQAYDEDKNNRYRSNPLKDDDYRYNIVK